MSVIKRLLTATSAYIQRTTSGLTQREKPHPGPRQSSECLQALEVYDAFASHIPGYHDNETISHQPD